jgi:hypothetical protein
MGWDRNNINARISRALQLLESFEFTRSIEDLDACYKGTTTDFELAPTR